MIKVRIKKTGEIKELTRNEAFALIDKKEAEVYVRNQTGSYTTRELRSDRS